MSTIQSDWSDIKNKIKEKWDKFSDKEIEAFKDNMDSLSESIQRMYGYAKDHAEKEYKEFRLSLTHLIDKHKTPEIEPKKEA